MTLPHREEKLLSFRQPELNQWMVAYMQAELPGKNMPERSLLSVPLTSSSEELFRFFLEESIASSG